MKNEENKIYILNEQRYKQIEIEVENMDELKTVFFLVPETETEKYILFLEDCLCACNFTIAETIEETKENNKNLFYMCTMYDNRIEYEL